MKRNKNQSDDEANANLRGIVKRQYVSALAALPNAKVEVSQASVGGIESRHRDVDIIENVGNRQSVN